MTIAVSWSPHKTSDAALQIRREFSFALCQKALNAPFSDLAELQPTNLVSSFEGVQLPAAYHENFEQIDILVAELVLS